MQKLFFTLLAICFFAATQGQSLSQVTITGNGNIDVFVISLEENVQIYLTKDGTISKWGFDRFIGVQENYGGQLDPYVGRIEYYTKNDDAALQGKVKYIGKTLLTYYSSFENEMLKGKIKAIGTTNFDYFLNYEDAAYKGNIKQIGQQSITWHSSFDNEGYRGKLKSIGSTSLAYFGSFEDKAYKGKVKSIGSNSFTYYSSFEKYSGGLKSGNPFGVVNSVKYFVRGY
jgi:hypothetical protein